MECIFCRIINNEIPSTKIYEDDKIIAIKDIEPAAPEHILVMPKKHTKDILEADNEITAYITNKVPQIAKELGLAKDGFRVVINTGNNGGQTVSHLHFHVLGGRQLQWPPG